MIVFNRLTDGNEYEEFARFEDGEVLSGEEELAAVIDFDRLRELDEDRLLGMFDGPRVIASKRDEDGVEKAGDEEIEIVDAATGALVGKLTSEGVLKTDDIILDEMLRDIASHDGSVNGVAPGEPGYFEAVAEQLPESYEVTDE